MNMQMTIEKLEVSYEVVEEDEPVKLCRQCGEWWPSTDEFFHRSTQGTFRSPCKACIQERRYETNTRQTCCVPGCNQPRRVTKEGLPRYSRCEKHEREHAKRHYKPRPRAGLRDGVCCVDGCEEARHVTRGGMVMSRCFKHMSEQRREWRQAVRL